MKQYDIFRNMSEQLPSDQMRAQFWQEYFDIEKGVYQKILKDRPETIEGTLQELAERYEVEVPIMAGFFDGMNESVTEPLEIEDLEEDTPIKVTIDYPALYKNMLRAKAKWLYTLKEWEQILDNKTRQDIKKDHAKETIVVVEKKPGRNDPCWCGSGKKYKNCHLNEDQAKEAE